MIDSLGPAGMSSDDSAGEEVAVNRVGEPPLFMVNQLAWRSFDVKTAVRALDEVHRHRRRGTRGAHPRIRLDGDVQSTRPYVAHQPLNFYSTGWYSGLRGIERAEVGAREEHMIDWIDYE